MSSKPGFSPVLLSVLLWISVAQCSFDIQDLNPVKCRLAGILVAVPKDNKYKFNYTTAVSVCQELGLTLASKVQVQKANRNGFETCSYGWVSDQIAVISRIQHNEKCGKNQTGVLTWSVEISKPFHAYCFNSSDMWVNSCKPEFPTTNVPTTKPQASTASEVLPNETSNTEIPRTTVMLHHLQTTSTIYNIEDTETATTEMLSTSTIPETETDNKQGKQASTHNGNSFGSLPAALLTLALLFFAVAVVLGVCYIKKYKTNLLFTQKKEEKENVETKVFKENGNGELPKTEEQTPPSATMNETLNCLEAEV
ncbi:lymphatic vessel endothelial hyaluronic acid receptor 1 [Pelobates cultripes]|uniref:Lymphatic vessel endothelial hyaluronic acid receptor 1 n=1 Tax=Pelobates cultripes TaxID=61616 RepID=A0AAD1WTH2_PELCU|nr:lymphatic vessel endothelial hyaluronic acid receptor 1 [Pelobates cultripes]